MILNKDLAKLSEVELVKLYRRTDNQKIKEQIVTMLREQLNDEEFKKYYNEGKKLTLEEAAELASNDVEKFKQ